jgi:hypothetical protein
MHDNNKNQPLCAISYYYHAFGCRLNSPFVTNKLGGKIG